MKKILISVSLFLCAAVPISAAFGHKKATSIDIEKVSQEQRKVSVVVNDKNGPVIGANVLVKGTTIGNITDLDGKAVIEGVPQNAVLVISFIGYLTQEIPLNNNQKNIEVTLVEDTQTLSEVMVVGYGSVKNQMPQEPSMLLKVQILIKGLYLLQSPYLRDILLVCK